MLFKSTSVAKRSVLVLLAFAFLLVSCGGPKPYYKTRVGKKKQKYYNDIQFGGKSASEMKPVKKR